MYILYKKVLSSLLIVFFSLITIGSPYSSLTQVRLEIVEQPKSVRTNWSAIISHSLKNEVLIINPLKSVHVFDLCLIALLKRALSVIVLLLFFYYFYIEWRYQRHHQRYYCDVWLWLKLCHYMWIFEFAHVKCLDMPTQITRVPHDVLLYLTLGPQ